MRFAIAMLLLACTEKGSDSGAMTDKPTDSGFNCESIWAACPTEGGRSYWSACSSGAWGDVSQCLGATCVPAEHGQELMHGIDGSTWIDLWAVCDDGYGHLEGTICGC